MTTDSGRIFYALSNGGCGLAATWLEVGQKEENHHFLPLEAKKKGKKRRRFGLNLEQKGRRTLLVGPLGHRGWFGSTTSHRFSCRIFGSSTCIFDILPTLWSR